MGASATSTSSKLMALRFTLPQTLLNAQVTARSGDRQVDFHDFGSTETSHPGKNGLPLLPFRLGLSLHGLERRILFLDGGASFLGSSAAAGFPINSVQSNDGEGDSGSIYHGTALMVTGPHRSGMGLVRISSAKLVSLGIVSESGESVGGIHERTREFEFRLERTACNCSRRSSRRRQTPSSRGDGEFGRSPEDGRSLDGLAADLAERRPGVRKLGGARRDDVDALADPDRHASLKPVVNDKHLPDSQDQRLGVRGEVAVNLNEKPFGIDGDQHSRRGREPVQVVDRGSHDQRQELAGHVGIVGLNDVAAVELGLAEPDKSRPLGRLRRGTGGRPEPARAGTAPRAETARRRGVRGPSICPGTWGKSPTRTLDPLYEKLTVGGSDRPRFS